MKEKIMSSICENERKNLKRLQDFRLGSHFKKIGIIGVVLMLLLLIISRLIDLQIAGLIEILKNGILVFLLFITLSRDKEEDEMTNHLRAQSFTLAFVCGVGYVVFQSTVNYIAASFFGKDLNQTIQFSTFQILFILIAFQILFYHTLKRFN